jgi:hypothetical protein
MKCKTCKHWKSNPFGTGICSGITSEFKTVSLPSVIDKKGNEQKRSKLLRVRYGIFGIIDTVMTPPDFYCKNWRQK